MRPLTFLPYRAGHLRVMRPQEIQRKDHAVLAAPGNAEALATGFGLSAWDGLRCVAVAGVLPISPHKAIAWAVLSEQAAPSMMQVVRKVSGALALLPYRRIEMTVREDFKAGHRFARAVGMTLETPEPMRGYGANGEDEMMYSRVKECQ